MNLARSLRAFLVGLVAVAFSACSGPPMPPLADAPYVDLAFPLRGVPDPGADPAVVLLDLDGAGHCSGALLASDVVLTARRCLLVAPGDASCPAPGPAILDDRDLTTIRVLVGDDAGSAVERARGRAVLLPPGDALCGADIALLLLDSTLDDIAPLVASPTGAAVGDHVRSVSYASGRKLVRDHVPVAATSASELELTEAACDATPGGPAIDEVSGDVVGVLSRSGPACGASDGYDVATRVDAFSGLVAMAMAEGTISHAADQSKQKKGPVDLGASCVHGSDCAAGVCVMDGVSQYCTQPCAAHDACPTDSRCMNTQQSFMACVAE
ncbi:MAG: trypsin-like peptidase domain-containing protein [Polyangiaceae bacterium]|jgi:hypothetical protein